MLEHSTLEKVATKLQVLGVAILVGLLLIGIVGFGRTIHFISMIEENALEKSDDSTYDLIWQYLESLTNNASNQVTLLATNLENNITEEFGDNLSELEEALNSDTNAECVNRLHNTIRNTIDGVYFNFSSKSNKNGVIVLENYNTIFETLIRNNVAVTSDEDCTDISTFMNSTYNQALFDDAMDKIVTHSDALIAMEPRNYIKGEHLSISTVNYDTLKEVFLNEGIYGLKNYQFFVAAYITDTGDIFGHSDVINGQPQQNHKFVVLLSFNLYDQLYAIDPSLASNAIEYKDAISSNYSSIQSALYLFGIAIIIVAIMVIAFMCTLYNVVIDLENDHKREEFTTVDSDNDNIQDITTTEKKTDNSKSSYS
jgi:hypothetical protein